MPTKETTLECTVASGMFSSEREISVELSDGRMVSAFVDEHQVIPSRRPEADERIDGKVKVAIVKEHRDSVVVDLPQPTFANGTRITVNKNKLS